ncbi:MAG: flavin reductase family protein [Myxococcota bacterium]
MGVPPERFKQVLGSWASGVSIVTSSDGSRCQGMTVSAFSSVSLDPPLILVCADKSSETHALIEETGVFSVSLLGSEQSGLSSLFADKRREDTRFDDLECEPGVTGCPRIPGALASLDCRVEQAIDAGDHCVYIGAVEAGSLGAGEPLVHFRSRYHGLTPL